MRFENSAEKIAAAAAAFVSTGLLFGNDAAMPSASVGVDLTKLAAAIAVGLGTFGAASAQGKAASAALEGITRNPSSKDSVFIPLLLSMVFMEFQALLAFVVSLIIQGVI